MKFKFINKGASDHILIPFFTDGLQETSWYPDLPTQKLKTKAGECSALWMAEEKRQLFLLCLGDQQKPQAAFKAFRSWLTKSHSDIEDALLVDLRHLSKSMIFQCVLGLDLAQYQIGSFKSDAEAFKLQEIALLVNEADPGLLDEALATSEAVRSAMYLVDTPANVKTPQFLAKWARDSGKEHHYRVEVLPKEALEKEELKALLAVGQGSEHPPVLIKMEYVPQPDEEFVLGLVGKGVTFDTGGVSIKKATNMHYMKSDMGGAAAVMCAMELIVRLKLPINVVAVIPVAENAVDAHSVRPGDVIGSYSKKSIEIIDTDAEGRLILADALSYIQRHYQPTTIVDLATLTGSCVATLGDHASGIFTDSHALFEAINEAAERTTERVWRLPLWEEYEEDLESDVADVRNFSGKPVAGAITAAKFLQYFIKEHPRWAHLDIAGVAFANTEHAKMKSATGYGVRLLAEFAKSLSQPEH